MMKRYLTAKRLFFVWLCLAALLSWGGSARAEAVRVAVASNFIAPMKQLAADFTSNAGVHVVVSAGSTGKLYAQIKNGAPFDVFLAANAREPERLEADGAGVKGSRFTYAQGRLALWCRDAATPAQAQECLDQPVTRIAIANPRLAPYGQAAESVMAALDVNPTGRLVSGENIAQAFQLVWSGNVAMGFVALSQVQGRTGLQGAVWAVPSQLHAPIEQQAVLLSRAKDSPSAVAFVEFLRGAPARTVIASFGYDAPQKRGEVR